MASLRWRVYNLPGMPSPFPGMDPYIEATGAWQTFHHAFLTSCHDLLNECLPPNYIATLGERVELIDDGDLGIRARVVGPDVAVVHDPRSATPAATGSAASATLEPQTLPQATEWLDEPKQLYVQIVHLPEQRVVTDVELLSPSNKRPASEDRAAYLAKRKALFRHQINLVEIDLLVGGQRLKMLAPLPAGDYYAFVTRCQSSHQCDVYSRSVRDLLPTVAIPLRVDDGTAPLDLADAFRRTYERGRYERILRYSGPAPASLRAEDQEWARQRPARTS